MSNSNVKSILNFAENIYGLGKKMIEENLLDNNSLSNDKNNITNNRLSSTSISNTNISDNSIINSRVSENSVNNNRILSNSVSESNINSSRISNTSISDNNINNGRISSSSFLENTNNNGKISNISVFDNTVNNSIKCNEDEENIDLSKINYYRMNESLEAVTNCLEAVEGYIKGNNLNDSNILKIQLSEFIEEYNRIHEKVYELNYENENYRNIIENGKIVHDNNSVNDNKIIILENNINELKNEKSELTNKYLSLQSQNNKYLIELDEKISEIQNCKIKIDSLINELNDKNNKTLSLNSEISKLNEELGYSKINSCAKSDLERLKLHLIQVEDEYSKQIKDLEDSKQLLTTQVQNLSLDLNRTKLSIQEARTNYERQIRILNEQLNLSINEKESLTNQVVNLSKLTENQEVTISYLQNSLNDYQKELESQINLLTDNHNAEIIELKQKHEEHLNKSLTNLQHDLDEKYTKEINSLNQSIYHYQNQIKLLQQNQNQLTISNNNNQSSDNVSKSSDIHVSNDINNILLQNLLISYIRLPDQHKSFVFHVICNVIGIEPQDVQHDNNVGIVNNALSWIPIVNRFVSTTNNDQLINNEPSLSQLFMDYLEEESKKASSFDPYLPPIATEELKGIIERHQQTK